MKNAAKIGLMMVAVTALAGSLVGQPKVTTGPGIRSIKVVAPSSISITVTGAVLTAYSIQATSTFGTNYTTVGAVITDSSGSGSFTDPGTTALNSRRFYRLLQQTP